MTPIEKNLSSLFQLKPIKSAAFVSGCDEETEQVPKESAPISLYLYIKIQIQICMCF